MNKIFLIPIIFIFQTTISLISSNIIPEMEEENLFREINEHIQEIIDTMFTSLNLDTHFVSLNETRLLLTTLASLEKISEGKYYIYNDITNASRSDLKYNEFKNTSLFKLDKPIEEIMSEDFNEKNHSVRNKYDFNLNIDSIEIPDESDEALLFLRNYLNNINHIELSDLTKPSHKIKEMYEKHKQFKYARRRNLKVWIPSNSTEALNLNSRRVFKGNLAKIRKFPFVASIHVKDKFVCTGAVISRNMIITAASCLHEASHNSKLLQDSPHFIHVRVGSDHPNYSGERIQASNVFIHPNYESSTLTNNIAIIQIKKHLHLRKRSRKIRRIEYQRMNGGLPNSVHEVVLLGWGDKENSGQLSYSHLKIFKQDACVDMYSKYVTEMNFCAGHSGKGAGACQRDIGGPAVVSNVLVGVVSFGPPVCGAPHAPTVFTNIGHHVAWIENTVKGKQEIIPTPPTSPSFMKTPFIADFRHPPRSPFTQDMHKTSKSNDLLSNVFRDFMLQGQNANENSFNINQGQNGNQNSFLNQFANMWNTTTAASSTKSSQQYHKKRDLMYPFNINDYTTMKPTQQQHNKHDLMFPFNIGYTTMKPTLQQHNKHDLVFPFNINDYTTMKPLQKQHNKHDLMFPFNLNGYTTMKPLQKQHNKHEFNINDYTTMKSSQQHFEKHDLMLPFNIDDYTRTRGYGRPQTTTRLVNQASFQLKPFNFYTNNYNFSRSTNPRLEFPFQTRNGGILRYFTAAGTTGDTEPYDSTSESDNYESDENVGLEIEISTTGRLVTPPLMALYAPLPVKALQSSYTPQSYYPSRSLYPPPTYDLDTPYSFTTRDTLSRLNLKDSVELIKYFVKNKLGPIGSELGFPQNEFEAKAEHLLIKNYIKDRLFPMQQKFALRPSSTTKVAIPDISSGEPTEKFLGKKYVKNHITEKKKVKDKSDEFVLLLLKHTTSRTKKRRFQVAVKPKSEEDLMSVYPVPRRTTKRFRNNYDFMNVFRTTKLRLNRLKTIATESDDIVLSNENQNLRGREKYDIDKLNKNLPNRDPETDLERRLVLIKKQLGISNSNSTKERLLKYNKISNLSLKRPLKDMIDHNKHKGMVRYVPKSLFKETANRAISIEDKEVKLLNNIEANTSFELKQITASIDKIHINNETYNTEGNTSLTVVNKAIPINNTILVDQSINNTSDYVSTSTVSPDDPNKASPDKEYDSDAVIFKMEDNISSSSESNYNFSSPNYFMHYGNDSHSNGRSLSIKNENRRRTFIDYIDF